MNTLDKKIAYIDKKLQKGLNLRLFSGLFFLLLLIISVFSDSDGLTLFCVVYWVFIFPMVVARVRRVDIFKKTLIEKKNFLKDQVNKKRGIFNRDFTKEETNESKELLLTGRVSLFSLMNETWSLDGEDYLRKNILNPPQDKEKIVDTQKNVQSLIPYCKLFERNLFRLRSLDIGKINLENVQKDIDQKTENHFEKYALLGIGLWGISALSILGVWLAGLPEFLNNILFAYFLFLIFVYYKFGSFFQKSLSLNQSLRLLKYVFKSLEKLPMASIITPHIHLDKPYLKFKKLETIMNYLSVESHILVNVLLNIFLPYYLVTSLVFQKRLKTLSGKFSKYKSELQLIDFYSCLVFLHQYQTQTYPTISSSLNFEAQDIFVPLIDHSRVVKNSIILSHNHSVHVLMGSNMSGKSTFLRTLAINQTLAQIGAPVFAKKMITFPAQILSCILIEDSIEDSVSYFMKEVRRLKKIFNTTKKDDFCFYFIDELFKGTNPKERLIAADSYLREISQYKSIGIVTTHDPELGFIEKQNNKFKSWHMENHILQEGPATSTNALKILRAEGLPVYE